MDIIVWSSRGTYFAVPADNKIHVFGIDVAGIVSTVQCNSRITCITFIQVIIVNFTYLTNVMITKSQFRAFCSEFDNI